ncbi:hypothetical protein [Nonomuraea angiospora]|uniref:hypothetical protein n=1 Tax=Nonomuraea TaxID=83681 RepID=UPI00331F5E31
MRKLKQRTALILTTVAMLAGSVAVSGPANAASSPIDACGGGSYHVIDSHDLGAATIYLLYNGSTNCVVTWKDSPDSTWVSARISLGDWESVRLDSGRYSTYAGPVKINAAGRCISWGGTYGPKYYYSPLEHCG